MATPRLAKRLVPMAVAALVIAGGCSASSVEPAPGERVSLTLDHQVYGRGDTVHVAVHNLSDLTLELSPGLCLARLQRRDDSNPDLWNDVPANALTDRVCTAQYVALLPHATVPFVRLVPADARGGDYRVLMPAPRAPEEANTATVTKGFLVAALSSPAIRTDP